MKFINLQMGPCRKERRAAASEARSRKPASKTAKRMVRPEKQEMLSRGFMKLDDAFHIRKGRHS